MLDNIVQVITGVLRLRGNSDQTLIGNNGNRLLVDSSITQISGSVLTLGQTTMSASIPVTIASNQSALAVSQSGTWNINNVSGTITLPTGASTSALQSSVQGSASGGTAATSSNLVGGIYNSSTPTLTNAQQASLQLTSSGALKVDASATTQPISGTITANQGTTPWTTNVTQFGSSPIVTGTGTSGSGIPRVTISNDSNILATQSGTWNINNISGVITLPTGASTSALQTTANTSLNTIVNTLTLSSGSTTSGQTGNLSMGAVTTSSPAYTTGTTNYLSLTTSGALRVDGSAVTQPVSGTVTVNQGTSPWVNNISQFGGSSVSLGQKVSASSIPVVIPSDQTIPVSQSTSPWITKDNADGPVTPGTVASNSILIGGQYNSTYPTLSTGQQSAIQIDSNGRLIVTQSSTNRATYSASVTGFVPGSSPTDILSIIGSSSKKITINKINISGIQTTSGIENVSLIKRSTLNTGGGFGSVVQNVSSLTTVNSTTATITVSATGSGNLLIVGAMNNDNRNVSSITDGTNSFTQATGAAATNGPTHTDIWYLLSSTSRATTITVTFSGTSTTKSLFFLEISGSNIAFETATHLNNGTSGATDTGSSVTVSNPDIIVGLIGTTGTITSSPATGSSFTNGTIQSNSKSAIEWLFAANDTYTPSWNDSGILTGFCSSTAAFIAISNNTPTIPAVPHDSSDAAATATVKTYLTNPTLGTTVGKLRSAYITLPTSTGQSNYLTLDLHDTFSKGIILNNANESLNINFNSGSMSGATLAIDVEWIEQ